MAKKQWGGRFAGSTDALMERLGESVSFDSRLALWDIRASRAHARMLGVRGIISPEDSRAILRGLDAIEKEVKAGKVAWDVSLEDVHTNIEAMLIARIGNAGKKLHTARSRNDQIATDVRLWLQNQIDDLLRKLRALRQALVALAEQYFHVILPGFTHLQHAQPVLFAHHLMAYHEMFSRDQERMDSCFARVNRMPLGAAALAGTPYPIDRNYVARLLGYPAVTENSIDSVSDRDTLIEFCSAAAITMMHLSRFCEELIIWATPEFQFIELPDAFCTGSSIMPQKKNPDVAELIRGKTGRVYGHLVSLLTLLKGLPLSYNRDLQEDKEPLFDCVETLRSCLRIFTALLPKLNVLQQNMTKAAEQGYTTATDLADYLTAKGVPFRTAHEIVGRIVAYGIKHGKALHEMTLEELQTFSKAITADARTCVTIEHSVRSRAARGGTAPQTVKKAINNAWKQLQKKKKSHAAAKQSVRSR